MSTTPTTPSHSTEPAFGVVVNDEGQHSVWWCDRTPPAGWEPTGFTGTRAECLDRIQETWTDLRPRSAR
jgi:MbtH protein